MRTPPLILVVDDEQSFREIISARLKAAGYHIEVAHSGDEGIKQAEALMPDLVLMDVYMPPGQNGTNAALALKQNPKTKDLHIAFLTSMKDPWPGISSSDNQGVAKELGMDEFFDKTHDLNVIADKVAALLQAIATPAQ